MRADCAMANILLMEPISRFGVVVIAMYIVATMASRRARVEWASLREPLLNLGGFAFNWLLSLLALFHRPWLARRHVLLFSLAVADTFRSVCFWFFHCPTPFELVWHGRSKLVGEAAAHTVQALFLRGTPLHVYIALRIALFAISQGVLLLCSCSNRGADDDGKNNHHLESSTLVVGANNCAAAASTRGLALAFALHVLLPILVASLVEARLYRISVLAIRKKHNKKPPFDPLMRA